MSIDGCIALVRKGYNSWDEVEAARAAVLAEATPVLERVLKQLVGDPVAFQESTGQFVAHCIAEGVGRQDAVEAAGEVIAKVGGHTSHPSGTLGPAELQGSLNSGRPRGPARRVMSAAHQRSRLNAGDPASTIEDNPGTRGSTRPGAKMPPVADSYPIPGQEDATGPKPRAPKVKPGQDEEDEPSGPRRQDFGDPGSAVDKIAAKAELLRAQNPDLTPEQAFAKVYTTDKALFLEERDARLAKMGLRFDADGRVAENVV